MSPLCRAGRGWVGWVLLALATAALAPGSASAQEIDLSHGGPIDITAKDGIEWHQAQQEVIASGDAKAVRANVTVTADRLIAWYRKKPGASTGASTGSGAHPRAAEPRVQSPAGSKTAASDQPGLAGDTDTGGNEVYRVQAEGHVHIYTQTDQVWGDEATYDMDQAVLVITGHDLRLTTPNAGAHRARRHGVLVATAHGGGARRRGGGDQRRPSAAGGHAGGLYHRYSVCAGRWARQRGSDRRRDPKATQVADKPGTPPKRRMTRWPSSGKLQKVDVFGHVLVRTVTDTVTGDRAVYVPDTGIARVAGTCTSPAARTSSMARRRSST